MLDITLISVGKLKDKNLASLADIYIKRLKPFAKIRLFEVESVPFSDKNKEASKKLEGENLLKVINREENSLKGGLVYLLAERGKSFKSSEDLSSFFHQKSPLILVIGGALGFSDELYEKYPQISLSALTYTHEFARVILLEQLYRASMIGMNKNYHY